MSQRSTWDAHDANMLAAFVDSGLADEATYTAPTRGALPQSCVVMIGHEPLSELPGGGLQTQSGQVRITGQLSQLSAPPAEGGKIVADGKTYTIKRVEHTDQAGTMWSVLCPRP